MPYKSLEDRRACWKRHYSRNQQKYVERIKLHKKEMRAYLNKVKTVPCMDCGVSYPPYIMDFDHREDKKFNVGKAIGRTLKQIQSEISKCDVVCANCHRERTHGPMV